MAVTTVFFDIYFSKTRLAYTWTRILNTPFWALYTLLPFIMCKDLKATPWEIACIISLRPMVSLLSLYWSAPIKRRPDRLVPNIVWAGILSHLPFLFVPWISHPWFFILASAVYMLFHRGVNPAWMEVLRVNVPAESRKTVFAWGSGVYHVGGALLAFGIGWLLDDYQLQAWRWLFPITALCSLGAVMLQATLPIKAEAPDPESSGTEEERAFNLRERLQKPWKDTWELMRARPDFARFQMGFIMLGGGGLMLWQPALPQFFFEILHLNYKELTFAMTLCKSMGYAAALPIWTRAMNRTDIFFFSAAVTAMAALFPLGVMAAQWNLMWLYAAYLLYGMMQAGSELSWNLSGPIFSKQEDSSTYTGVNIVSIGLRGCIAPPLGSWLCQFTHPATVLLMGGILCLAATWQMYAGKKIFSESWCRSAS